MCVCGDWGGGVGGNPLCVFRVACEEVVAYAVQRCLHQANLALSGQGEHCACGQPPQLHVALSAWELRTTAGAHAGRYIERTIGGDTFHVGEDFLELEWHDGNLGYNQDQGEGRALVGARP